MNIKDVIRLLFFSITKSIFPPGEQLLNKYKMEHDKHSATEINVVYIALGFIYHRTAVHTFHPLLAIHTFKNYYFPLSKILPFNRQKYSRVMLLMPSLKDIVSYRVTI